MAQSAPWTTKRKLFVVELVIFIACMVGGVVFLLTGYGFSHAIGGSLFILVVMLVHLGLRLTYFKTVLPDIRRQREDERSD